MQTCLKTTFLVDGKVDDAQKKWNSMNVKLDGADLTKYIRHFW